MKNRNLLFTAALVLSSFVMNAQNTNQGDKILNFGFGLGNNYFSGNGYSTTFPPVAASFEVIVKDGLFNDGKGALGVGGQLGFIGYKYYREYDLGGGVVEFIVAPGELRLKSTQMATKSGNNHFWESKNSQIIIGPRGYLHYNFIDKLDTYTGLMLGLNFFSYKGGYDDDPKKVTSSNSFAWSWFVGGRYYFNDQLAAVLELGYGVTYANIGIAYKF